MRVSYGHALTVTMNWITLLVLLSVLLLKAGVFGVGSEMILRRDQPNTVITIRIGTVFYANASDADQLEGIFQNVIESYNRDQIGYPRMYLEAVLVKTGASPHATLNDLCSMIDGHNLSAVVTVADRNMLISLSLLSSWFTLPIIGLENRDWSFSNKDIHPLFLRMVPSSADQVEAVVHVLERYGLYSFSILASEQKDSDGFINAMKQATIYSDSHSFWAIRYSLRFTKESQNITGTLQHLDGEEKVIILHCQPEEAIQIFEEAHTYHMNLEGYAWIVAEEVITTDERYLASYPEGLIAIRYMSTMSLAQRTTTAVRAIAESAKYLLNDQSKTKGKLKNLQEPLSCNQKPSTLRNLAEMQLFEYIKTMNDSSGEGMFNSYGDIVNPQYELLNLVIIDGVKVWERTGTFANKTLDVSGIRWPGHSYKTPKPGADMQNLIVVAKITPPFVDATDPDENYMCIPAKVCIEAKTHDKEKLATIIKGVHDPEQRDQYRSMIKCCTGIMVDLMDAFKRDMPLSYTLYLVADEKPGAKDPKTNTWDGMMQDLVGGAADLAIGAFSITKDRSEAIDFTTPFYHSGFSIMVARSKESNTKADAFLAPLESDVWILIVVTVHIVAVSITIFEWMSPYGLTPRGRNRSKIVNFPSALTHTWSMLFSHTYPSKAPKCWSARWVINFWGAFAFVFIASYTANLAAFMAGITKFLQLDGIYDSRLQHPDPHNKIRFTTIGGSSTENYINLNWPAMADHMSQFSTKLINESVAKVSNESLDAFIYDSPIIAYQVATDPACVLMTVGGTFGGEGYGIGLPPGSSLNQPLSELIQNYTSGVFLEELDDKWFRGASPKGCSKPDYQGNIGLGLSHVEGLFYFFATGVGTSFLCLILEIVAYKTLVPFLRKQPKESRFRNLIVCSQRLHRAVNGEPTISPKVMIQDMINIVKTKQFHKLLFKEELRKERAFSRSMQRMERPMAIAQNDTLTELVNDIRWVKRGSERRKPNELPTVSAGVNNNHNRGKPQNPVVTEDGGREQSVRLLSNHVREADDSHSDDGTSVNTDADRSGSVSPNSILSMEGYPAASRTSFRSDDIRSPRSVITTGHNRTSSIDTGYDLPSITGEFLSPNPAGLHRMKRRRSSAATSDVAASLQSIRPNFIALGNRRKSGGAGEGGGANNDEPSETPLLMSRDNPTAETESMVGSPRLPFQFVDSSNLTRDDIINEWQKFQRDMLEQLEIAWRENARLEGIIDENLGRTSEC